MEKWLELLSWFLIVLALLISGMGAKTGDSQLMLRAVPVAVFAVGVRIMASDNARKK